VSRIIDDLLDLTRIESEATPPREPVLVNLVMAEAVERVRAAADQRDISIVLYEPPASVAVVGDRRQLVSAMSALLENAVTYSYEESTVTVTGQVCHEAVNAGSSESVRIEDPGVAVAMTLSDGAGGEIGAAPTPPPPPEYKVAELPPIPPIPLIPPVPSVFDGSIGDSADSATREVVRLSVTDHGIGIPARDLERIFERFYRVDHGRSRNTGGTGLGLSIVRHVANNHHGRVDVESREGEGSTFTLVLPLQQDGVS